MVPDNTKTGVTKACRYDPDLNPTYQEMAMHYGIGVVPARPYKAAPTRPRSNRAYSWRNAGSSRRFAIGSSSSIEELGTKPSVSLQRPHQRAALP